MSNGKNGLLLSIVKRDATLLVLQLTGVLVQLFCCCVWYEIFDQILPLERWTDGNTAALYVCRIILGILIIILHFVSVYSIKEEMFGGSPFTFRTRKIHPRANTTYHYHEWHFYDDSQHQENSTHNKSETFSEKDLSDPEDDISHPFHGCSDIESLKRRYKKLARAYHPDETDGNAETFQYIQHEYDRLLKKYS